MPYEDPDPEDPMQLVGVEIECPDGSATRDMAACFVEEFLRMGFSDELAELDEMRKRGASHDEVADAFPPELLKTVGYYGPAGGAAAAFGRLAEGLDIAVVRVVAARPGIASTRAVLEACKPELVG